MDYIALVHKEKKSDYGISFPDFPTCISAAESFDKVREMAEEALALHIDGLKADGEKIPSATPLDKLHVDNKNLQAMILITYHATKKASKVIKVNMTMEEDLVRKVDRKAKKNGLSRSAYFARLAQKDCA